MRGQKAFLARFQECGRVQPAADAASVCRSALYKERKRNPEFAQAWEDALAIAMGQAEDEVRRRAVEGVLQPVFQGGEHVGNIRKYSDVLLMFMLKAHNPAKYRDNWKSDGDQLAPDLDTWAQDTLEEG